MFGFVSVSESQRHESTPQEIEQLLANGKLAIESGRIQDALVHYHEAVGKNS